MGYRSWGHKESDMTEYASVYIHAHTHTHTHTHTQDCFPQRLKFHQQCLRWLHEIKRTFNGPVHLILPCWFLFLLFQKDVIDYERCIPPLLTSKNQGGASQVAQWVKESACNTGDAGSIPWRRAWRPTPVFLPGKSCGQRSLVGYSP